MAYNFAMGAASHSGHAGPLFTSTRWSVILAARDHSGPGSAAAMASLCATYWRPLYAYVRRQGRSVEDAQDLTQSFFSHILEKGSLRHVDPSLGRFRSFLLVSIRNFLAGEWRHAHASKRGGEASIVSLEDSLKEVTRAEDSLAAGGAESRTPEEIYERNWALALLEKTTARLSAEFEAAGKKRVFESLIVYLTGEHDGRPYSEVAAKLGITEVTVRVAVHRMRGRFQDLLRDEVARTLPDPDDPAAIIDELRYLLSVL
jgi:RNA polymerase sigma-70 factor (ECF subfamily)